MTKSLSDSAKQLASIRQRYDIWRSLGAGDVPEGDSPAISEWYGHDVGVLLSRIRSLERDSETQLKLIKILSDELSSLKP